MAHFSPAARAQLVPSVEVTINDRVVATRSGPFSYKLPLDQNPMTPYGGTQWPPVTSTELGDQGGGGGDGGFKDVSLGLLSSLVQSGHHFGGPPGGIAGL